MMSSALQTRLFRARYRAARGLRFLACGALAIGGLAGCDETGQFALPFAQNAGTDATGTTAASSTGRVVERDVEAPEVFSVTDQGLWDGRPSLGGVWVAHPDVSEPERVIIRNQSNDKFVIGALFRKERDLPGPKLQISSDAAAALDILAGAPAPLNVTALRREETVEEAPADAGALPETDVVAAPADVSESTLDPIAAASAAIEAAPDTTPATTATVASPAPAPAAPPPQPRPSSLAKPFVQIGIFSVEANATRAANQMRSAGMIPTVRKSEINGKPFWRVLVGPATRKSELDGLLAQIKAEGFSDAYAVTN